MMKTRKILAVLLAIVMVLGLCSMASAAAPNDRVQVNNMMVDAALVETAEQESREVCSELTEHTPMVIASTSTAFRYPPIADISVGNNSSCIASDDGTNALYVVHVPNGGSMSSATFNFALSAASSQLYSGETKIQYGTSEISITKGGTGTLTMPLTSNAVEFDVVWFSTLANAQVTTHCKITVDTSSSVTLNDATVVDETGATATIDSLTAGGVTRYTCEIELPSGSSNTSVNVQFRLESIAATATLGGVAASETEYDFSTMTALVTFNGVDFSSAKDLVITNGTASRTYVVSAVAAGSTVTVHIAIRTFLADEWLNGSDYWYDGYTDDGLTQSDRESLLATAAYLRSANSPTTSSTASDYNGNAPLSPDTSATNNRFVFSEASYVTLTVPANYSVREVLNAFTSNTTYFPEGFSIQGSESYIEAMGKTSSSVIGEFDCGYASGWMYTARVDRTDTETALPNAGANMWPISDGMYIDWYYTAAYGEDFGYSMFGI